MSRDKIRAEDVREEDIRPLRLWLVDGTFIDFKKRYYAHRDGYVLAPIIPCITPSGPINIYEITRRISSKVGAERFNYCMSLNTTAAAKYRMLDVKGTWSYDHFRYIARSGWTPDTPIHSYYKLTHKKIPSASVDITYEDAKEGNIHRRYSMSRMIYYSFNDVDMDQVHRAIVRKDTTTDYFLDNLKLGRRVNVDATMNRSRYGWMSTNNVEPDGYNEDDYMQVI